MKSSTRSWWAALAVLTTITLAACSSGGDGSSAEGGQVEDPGATVSTTVARSFEDLAKTLDLAVPESYVLQSDEVGETGPADLEKAARDDGAADAKEVLTRTRFVRGYQRMWKAGRDEIVSYVYQFADHAGAAEYTAHVAADASAPSAGVSIEKFEVPGIHEAVGVDSSDPAVAESSVTFVKGAYSVQVVLNGPSPDGLQALVTALAEEQYSRL